MKIKVSDLIVRFFEEKGVKHAFGIIGSANAHIFDSIFHRSGIELICNHHEQACTMAVQTYWKVSQKPTFALVTAGAGSSNAITGVLSAWADSIPCIILSGQENARYVVPDPGRRLYGIQGYDSPFAVSKMTKYAKTVTEPERVLYELEKAWFFATSGRPGPSWLDFPMSVQSSMVEEDELCHYEPEVALSVVGGARLQGEPLSLEVSKTLAALRSAKRPLLWLGVGIRIARAQDEISAFLEALGVPALVSWSALDLLGSEHPLCAGSAGVYGQRAANFILQSCDCLVTLGTRLAIPQVGYDIMELARDAQHITVVDIDESELQKYPQRFNHPVCADARDWIHEAMRQVKLESMPRFADWIGWCQRVKGRFPLLGPEHKDQEGFINSYGFMNRLASFLNSKAIVVTDMGTALLSGHQALPIKPPQRMLTSQGLGEMGFGLPGAIGACVANDRREVICLNCDGGMMMNLQELQTVVHHRFPIKIFIFNNDGYLMIKHTQKAVLKGRYAGTDQKSGVSCPDYSKIATAFGMPSHRIHSWEDFEREMPLVMAEKGPVICEVMMHPEQFFHPKLGISVQADGTLISPPLEDLSPFLPAEVLEENLKVPLHPKSKQIRG